MCGLPERESNLLAPQKLDDDLPTHTTKKDDSQTTP
jgi:hypothetical protein